MEILKVEHLSKTYGTGEAKVEALKDEREQEDCISQTEYRFCIPVVPACAGT